MLHVHRSDDAAVLVDALGALLSAEPLDPLLPEVVSIPTRGIERWIAQELALRLGASPEGADGIAANIHFKLPGQLVAEALAATAAGASVGAWSEDQLVWPVLASIDATLDELSMGVVARFIRGDGRQPREGRRMEAARRIARLFASYDRERPDLVRAWAAGEDIGADGSPLGEEWRWQPPLWRSVRRQVGSASPAECLGGALDSLTAGEAVPALPSRVAVYGLTALPPGHLQILAALAQQRDVHLFLLHPSPALWEAVEALPPGRPGFPQLRSDDATTALALNPLLASWGRDARELQVLLGACNLPSGTHYPAPPVEPSRLLLRLQDDIRHNRRPPGRAAIEAADARPFLDPDDRSLQIHACHGPTRQAEALRDAILHLLADDPTLEPRDIVVMCPDVEAYAPLVEAAFRPDARQGDTAGIPDVRCRIADRSPVDANPLVDLTLSLLKLARSRVTASAVLTFAALDPVRRRFRSDDLLGVMAELVDDAQIGWGLDGDHRADHGLPGRSEATWAEGLERLLAGLMVADRTVELVGSRLPLAGMEGDDVEAVERLAEMISRLGGVLRGMQDPMPAARWREVLGEASEALGDAGSGGDWQRRELNGLLDALLPQESEPGPTLTLPEILVLLSPLAKGRPGRVNHRTGDLTVCALAPMRSVPHRVICLLGMDDGAFPRSPGEDGDDVLAFAPAMGSREWNAEDRQLLLDALMAARDHLVITFSGHDEHTNAAKPPAVPIAELIDAVDLTVRSAGPQQKASDAVVVHHPLQPFDPANFSPAPGHRLGFSRRMLEAARVHGAAADHPLRPIPDLPSLQWRALPLTDLQAFLEHPARAFAATRLGFRYPDDPEPRDDTLPVELAPLSRWGVGQRLLDGALAGHDRGALLEAEWGRGCLPPGNLGAHALPEIEETVDAILGKVVDLGLTLPATGSRRIDLALTGGRRLTGTVGGLTGAAVATVQYSRVQPKHLAAAYLRLLALTAAAPDTAWRAVVIGRAAQGDGLYAGEIGPLGRNRVERQREAAARLAALTDLYDRGMRRPLPITMLTSHAYAIEEDREWGLRQAANAWDDPWNRKPEAEDPHHLLAFGGLISFEDLLAEPPLPDERGAGWPPARTRFEALALRLWEPILQASRGGP